MADWDQSWATLDPEYQRRQLGVFRDIAKGGWLVHKHRPIYWSPSSRTALAEAEIEYEHKHISRAAYVRFRLSPNGPSAGALDASFFSGPLYVVVWTTTAWTLPANRAIALHRDLDYSILRDDRTGDGWVFASSLLHVALEINDGLRVVGSVKGENLIGLSYLNPLGGSDSSPRPIIHADFVTEACGTGLVHLAPAHGVEDFHACNALGIAAESIVDDEGRFTAHANPDEPSRLTDAPSVIDGGGEAVLSLLGCEVLKVHDYKHTYPYDWRTKRPVIMRATDQWFLDVGKARECAIAAVESVNFHPPSGRSRLAAFVANRDEWCISRQRVWGLPIPVAYNAQGETSAQADVVDHMVTELEQRGIDAWFSDPLDHPGWLPAELKGGFRKADTMDVWLDSGCNFALADQLADQVADMCVEGSDQHRGWFQSSLLAYIMASSPAANTNTTGTAAFRFPAPYKTLVTHGFVLAEDGSKMSKSLGNTISPADIMEGRLLPPLRQGGGPDGLGPDALRLWVASVNYTQDVVVGPAVLQTVHSILIKLRVTLRLLLGSLRPRESATTPMTKLDQIALVQLEDTFKGVWERYGELEFSQGLALLHRWVVQDLSAFYIEALKDRLFCDDGGGVQDAMFFALLRMLAPIVPILVQEAWDHRPSWIEPDQPTYLPLLNTVPLFDLGSFTLSPDQIREDLPILKTVHGAVKDVLERCRVHKLLASSLQSEVRVHVSDPSVAAVLARYEDELDAIFVVSSLRLATFQQEGQRPWALAPLVVAGAEAGSVAVFPPSGHKCVRCWRYIAPSEAEPCARCAKVVQAMGLNVPHHSSD